MKRFIDPFATGGAPIYNDDLLLLQNGYLDLLKGYFTNLRSNNREGAVLTGVVVSTSAAFDTTAGIVFLDGEFYTLPAQSNIANPSYIVPDVDIVSQDTFRDGAVKNIIVEKRATVQATIPGSGQYFTINRATDNHYKFHNFTDYYAFDDGWSEDPSNKVAFKKNLDGTIWWVGELSHVSANVTGDRPINDNTALADLAPSSLLSAGFTIDATHTTRYLEGINQTLINISYLKGTSPLDLSIRINNLSTVVGGTDGAINLSAIYPTSDVL